MDIFRSLLPRLLRLSGLAACVILFVPQALYAEEMMGGKMSCPMCGVMGWGGMILGGVLILAIIAALVALTLYLIRRSRQPHPGQ